MLWLWWHTATALGSQCHHLWLLARATAHPPTPAFTSPNNAFINLCSRLLQLHTTKAKVCVYTQQQLDERKKKTLLADYHTWITIEYGGGMWRASPCLDTDIRTCKISTHINSEQFNLFNFQISGYWYLPYYLRKKYKNSQMPFQMSPPLLSLRNWGIHLKRDPSKSPLKLFAWMDRQFGQDFDYIPKILLDIENINQQKHDTWCFSFHLGKKLVPRSWNKWSLISSFVTSKHLELTAAYNQYL